MVRGRKRLIERPISHKTRYHRDAAWNQAYTRLLTFVEEHGHVPGGGQGFLSYWMNEVRLEYRETADKSTLSAAKISALEALPGWYWTTTSRHSLDLRVHQINEWLRENPHIERLEYAHSQHFPDFRLDKWMSGIRSDKKHGTLTAGEIQLIETIRGWEWVAKRLYRRSFAERELIWRLKTALTEEVRSGSAEGATTLWNCDIVVPSIRAIVEYDGAWVHEGKEDADRRKTRDLEAAGWHVIRLREEPLSLLSDQDLAVTQDEEMGHLAKKVLLPLTLLGATMRSKQHQHLDRYQGLLEQAHDPWYEGLAHLMAYVHLEANTIVPATYVDASGYRLGQWVYVQRRAKKREVLSERKIVLLDQVDGWVWEIMTEVKVGWEAAYARVVSFEKSHGRVPKTKASSDDGFKLGRWVSYQRGERRAGRLALARVQRLEQIPGWDWGHPRSLAGG